jgi:hypothetical protein
MSFGNVRSRPIFYHCRFSCDRQGQRESSLELPAFQPRKKRSYCRGWEFYASRRKHSLDDLVGLVRVILQNSFRPLQPTGETPAGKVIQPAAFRQPGKRGLPNLGQKLRHNFGQDGRHFRVYEIRLSGLRFCFIHFRIGHSINDSISGPKSSTSHLSEVGTVKSISG